MCRIIDIPEILPVLRPDSFTWSDNINLPKVFTHKLLPDSQRIFPPYICGQASSLPGFRHFNSGEIKNSRRNIYVQRQVSDIPWVGVSRVVDDQGDTQGVVIH